MKAVVMLRITGDEVAGKVVDLGFHYLVDGGETFACLGGAAVALAYGPF
ncbi:MAG: hypothetical protein DHS20C08_06080 [Rhodomicrobium sp.]|nr:MAG: hypothetical protein DHS20C08_06080 [Rhodomicrobium sp.]